MEILTQQNNDEYNSFKYISKEIQEAVPYKSVQSLFLTSFIISVRKKNLAKDTNKV